jgi:hypothetical protein
VPLFFRDNDANNRFTIIVQQQQTTMAEAPDHGVTWLTGQRVRVNCSRSKHYGRYGTITAISRSRLALTFEDELPGKFIDKSRAVIVATASPLVTTTVVDRPRLSPPERPAVVRDDFDHDMILVGNTSVNPTVSVGNPPSSHPIRPGVHSNVADRDMTELSRLLDHMAFTVATLISSNAEDPAVVSKTLAEFQAAVRDNTRLISQQRRERDQGSN